MGFLQRRAASTAQVDSGSLSDKLQWLIGFGKPTLRYCPSRPAGWAASIEMATTTPGAQFTIRSAWDHTTPDAAVDDLIQRIKEAVNA